MAASRTFLALKGGSGDGLGDAAANQRRLGGRGVVEGVSDAVRTDGKRGGTDPPAMDPFRDFFSDEMFLATRFFSDPPSSSVIFSKEARKASWRCCER